MERSTIHPQQFIKIAISGDFFPLEHDGNCEEGKKWKNSTISDVWCMRIVYVVVQLPKATSFYAISKKKILRLSG